MMPEQKVILAVPGSFGQTSSPANCLIFKIPARFEARRGTLFLWSSSNQLSTSRD
jgi:hypothetical protein